MDSSKSWVRSGVIPLKPNKWIATETIGEHCQRVGRVSEFYPCPKFSFFPEMLFVKEYTTFKSLGRRNVLLELLLLKDESVKLEYACSHFILAQTKV